MGPPIYIGGNSGMRSRSPVSGLLQWGHRFTSVETRKEIDVNMVRAIASMGPPIYIGGNDRLLDLIDKQKPSFNGATDLHRWKH